MDFLGRHGFGFDDFADAVLLGEGQDNLPGLLGVFRPVDVAAVGEDVALKFLKVPVQMVNGLPLDGGRFGPGVLPVGKSVAAAGDGNIVAGDILLDDCAVAEVDGLGGGGLGELLGGRRHGFRLSP